jgi:hypothetical protein
MKKILTAGICIAVLILNGCGPAVTFDKPQPDNVAALRSFPSVLQGEYQSADHASVLTITDRLITRYYDFDLPEHKDSLGSTYRLAGDTLIDQTTGTKEKVRIKGDTVFRHINGTDTLFDIAAGNVLKAFKGSYFLNKQYDDSTWEVKQLQRQKNLLHVNSISDKNDIKKLQQATGTAGDTASIHFSPTRRQFKQFIKQKGFGTQEIFIAVEKHGSQETER